MKKYLMFLILLVLPFLLVGCAQQETEGLVLRVYNWQDYIDEGFDDDGQKVSTSVMEEWQEWYFQTYGEKVEIVYDTFETCETMMNTLKTGKTTYDLICPSEYTIQKMIRLDMLDTYDYNLKDKNGNLVMTNYHNVSPYLINLFSDKGWNDYAVPYMWGTMGFIYNPETINEEDIKHWSILWNENYKNMATAKDSIRDTYVVGVMNVYYDELMALREDLQSGKISQEQYTKQIGLIMNRCDDETLEKVEKALKEMKNNVYGFEVDSGKSDIVTGKVSINFAWSGDAVYSLDVAEEENEVYLNYQVPEEGSNVWFDGWVMPKGADTFLAQTFVDYVSRPENAVRNMNMVGYTSAIAGQEVFDEISDWYDESVELDDGSFDTTDLVPYDLNYFFEGTLDEDCDGIIYTSSLRGQLYTQYPDLGTVERCAIMQDFGVQNNKVIEMWASVKAVNLPIWVTIGFFLIVAGLFALVIVYTVFNKRKFRKNKR